MRRNFIVTIDSEIINNIESLYLEELKKMLEKNKIKNTREFSKSRFVERIILIGMAFKDIDDDVMKQINDYMRRKRIKKMNEAVKKLIENGLRAGDLFP